MSFHHSDFPHNAGVVKLTGVKYEPKKLREELEKLVANDSFAHAAWVSYDQIGLTHRPGTSPSNIYHDACGSLLSKDYKLIAQASEFTELSVNSEYLQGVIEDMRGFIEQRGRRIGRVRFMKQKPKTCLSLHRDLDEYRFHIPVQTNGNAFFVVSDKVCRMQEAGCVYMLNTRAYHTAINADAEAPRVHLLFDSYVS